MDRQCDSPAPTNPPTLPPGLGSFVRTALGPASESLLGDLGAVREILDRMAGGAQLEDAALAAVHRRASRDPELANEFLKYFYADVLRTGRRVAPRNLDGHVGASDLVQSILGVRGAVLFEIEFESRAGFLRRIAGYLRNRAIDKAQRGSAAKRTTGAQGTRVDADTIPSPADSPASWAAAQELVERIHAAREKLDVAKRKQFDGLLAENSPLRGGPASESCVQGGRRRSALRVMQKFREHFE